MNSGHRVVSATLQISLRATEHNKYQRLKYNWNKLKGNTSLQAQFSIEVKNRHEVVLQHNHDNDIQTKYSNFVTAIEDTAEKLVAKLTQKSKKIGFQSVPLKS